MVTVTNFLETTEIQGKIEKRIDDPWGSISKHSLTDYDLINLAGGIPCKDLEYCSIIIDTFHNDVIDIYIKSSEFELQRELDFRKMKIQNSLMKVKNRGMGLGLNLLINQISTSKCLGFKSIELNAAGGSDWDNDTEWNGYYSWGKVGYLMFDNAAKDFQKWISSRGFNVKYLHELLALPEGRQVWKAEGFSWYGYFDLKDGSLSFEILQKYLTERKIKKHF